MLLRGICLKFIEEHDNLFFLCHVYGLYQWSK